MGGWEGVTLSGLVDAIKGVRARVRAARKALEGTGVGAQSTLGGQDIFARKICMKNF